MNLFRRTAQRNKMIVALLGIAGLAAFNIFANTFSYPFHASCLIDWTVDLSCNEVRTRLENQIRAWDNDNCPNVSQTCPKLPCGMKCKYEMMASDKPNVLKCLHKTVIKEYIDYLTFTFPEKENPTAQKCSFTGYSTSGVWYALLDYGVNYCNLRNLIDGSKISEAPGFQEFTNTSVCTLYGDTNCERY